MKVFGGVVLALFFIALIAFFTFSSKVPIGYTGVIVNTMGTGKGIQPAESGTGRIFLSWNEEMFLFPTFNQNVEIGIVTFQDKDGMEINAPIGLTIRAKEGAASLLYQTYRKGMDEIISVNLPQVVRTAFNNEGSKLAADAIYGPEKEAFLTKIENRIRKHFQERGIEVDSLYLTSKIGLPPSVVTALNAKIEANQKTAQRQNEVEQVIAEANKKREEAKGDKDAAISRAEGEAESLNLIGDSLRKNPGVVELRAIEKWDGKTPVYMGSGGPVPFINLK